MFWRAILVHKSDYLRGKNNNNNNLTGECKWDTVKKKNVNAREIVVRGGRKDAE